MKPFLVALVAGLLLTALPGGTVNAADPPVAVAASGTTNAGTAPGSAANTDSSRYKFYNGYWWYWLPDNRWLCYMNGQWVSPGTPVQASPPVQASVPAYVYPNYAVPQSYYDPYPYGYAYPYPYYGGGISFGFGGVYGGWHGGGGFHH